MTADLARFSINQMTVRQLSLPELVDTCRDLGVPGVGLWREPVQAYGVEAAAKLVREAGLTVTTLCRGGFLTATAPTSGRQPSPTTAAPSTRRRHSARTPWSWSRAASRPAPGTCAPPASASPTPWPNSPPTPGNTG
ncbi:hypothetical protein SHKM778_80710 [Streptomyces sp. KM77-8]|uniref:Sugar phosphate isomerase/epimerase n=1 Tax=Streptomyces haneummycinicus TaxID=3074435 RepID=A0AAT9HVN3_9ACTN